MVGIVSWVAVLAHIQALADGFVWDDFALILHNGYLPSLDRFWTLFVPFSAQIMPPDCARPVWIASAAFDWFFWGGDALGHHLTSLLLHGINAALVLAISLRLGAPPRGAAVGSLWFALHPLVVEPVHAVSFREDLLCLACMLLAACLFIRWLRRPWSLWKLSAVSALYYLGLLAKEMAAPLPLWLFALDLRLCPWRETRSRWLLYLVLSLAGGIWYAGVHRPRYRFETPEMDSARPGKPHGSAQEMPGKPPESPREVPGKPQGSAQEIPGKPPESPREIPGKPAAGGPSRARVIAAAAGRNLLTTVFPLGLSADAALEAAWPYRHPFAVSLLVAAAWGLTAAALWRLPLVGLGLLWFWLMQAPVSNLIPLMNPVADRYLYVPLAGMAVAAGVSMPRSRAVAAGLLMLALLSMSRGRIWRTDLTLWAETSRSEPRQERPLGNLGECYIEQGDLSRAARVLWLQLRVHPTSLTGHLNLGAVYFLMGKHAKADATFHRALAVCPARDRGLVYSELGRFYANTKRHAEAADALQTALAQPTWMEMGMMAEIVKLLISERDALGQAEEARWASGRLEELRRMTRRGERPGPDFFRR